MNTPLASAADLIEKARVVYASDSTIRAELDELDRSLTQPLRVALVGSVKAGKSTLLNGLLGERIAPTDARERTWSITCYHYGTTPAVTETMKSGDRVSVPTWRQKDRFEHELSSLSPDEVDRLDVYWPAPGLQGITLIDTPGVASISQDIADQTERFILPERGVMQVDAVMYLLRSATSRISATFRLSMNARDMAMPQWDQSQCSRAPTNWERGVCRRWCPLTRQQLVYETTLI